MIDGVAPDLSFHPRRGALFAHLEDWRNHLGELTEGEVVLAAGELSWVS